MEYREFIAEAADVRQSPRQAAWFDTEFYSFIHFTVNTYTDLEWGLGSEPESIFNPVNLDCDQWVAAIKSAGGRGMILTAKHHDGFCLWPSAYTEHSVKNCPWKDGRGDVVREAADACRRGGIKFGIYLSPWDRNSPYYGTPAYNDYYCNQLTELLTGYGEIFTVWFDGACGEGPNGKKQVYDFPRYFDLIRKYQPNAVIFNDHGPDVRWCGNEAGQARSEEWAVVPSEMCGWSEVQTGAGPDSAAGALNGLYNTAPEIGTTAQIVKSRGLVFTPSEINMSIRPGWFYHKNEEPHSLERLMRTYLTSVGGNTTFNLNIPPMPDGCLDERDVARMKELGDALRAAFGHPLDASVTKTDTSETTCTLTAVLPEKKHISYVELREDLNIGQRIERFEVKDDAGAVIYEGTTVGHKRICPVSTYTASVSVNVLTARAMPAVKDAVLYESAAQSGSKD